MADKEETSSGSGASKWVFFAVGCMATVALIYLLIERDKEGLGEAVFHTSGAIITGFGIFGLLHSLERRKHRR